MVYILKGHNAIPRYSLYCPKASGIHPFPPIPAPYTFKSIDYLPLLSWAKQNENNEPRISAKENKPQTIFEMLFPHFAASLVRSFIPFYFIAVCVRDGMGWVTNSIISWYETCIHCVSLCVSTRANLPLERRIKFCNFVQCYSEFNRKVMFAMLDLSGYDRMWLLIVSYCKRVGNRMTKIDIAISQVRSTWLGNEKFFVALETRERHMPKRSQSKPFWSTLFAAEIKIIEKLKDLSVCTNQHNCL